MMCYVINDWTYFGDPSKMHEYLSSGKPTVATGLPSIEEFRDVIMIPKTKRGWIEAIESGLNENDEKLKKKRINVANKNSYRYRVNHALKIIERHLSKK